MLLSLPVDAVLPELLAALRAGTSAVVVAPPGSGKTTRVPPALLELGPGKVLVLQPRRVAARLAARRIAEERGCRIGEEVGYSTRFDKKVSRRTRIEVLTEGLLLRRLQADPFLEGVSAVVLDEFHERSLDIDLAIALLREVVAEARPDLKLVVMSATLDARPVVAFLGSDCAVISASGRAFPVEHAWDPRPSRLRLEDRVAAAIRQELAAMEEPGHVLAFLPGVGEIRAAQRALEDPERPLPRDVSVFPLHGSLPAREQDAALAPSRGRKVVLATNIAETSVTLAGVRAVIDTGLAKVPRFDIASGVTRIERLRIPRSSADQRAGRAGRTGPGRCRRLWTEAEDRQLTPDPVPAVRRVDLAPVVLQLAAWGADPATFGWYERPSDDALRAATELLARLGALDGGGITALGRQLATLPLHPRLGRMLVAGVEHDLLASTATAGALLASRDILRRGTDPGMEDDDLALRLQYVAWREMGERLPREVDRGAVDEVRRVRDQLVRGARHIAPRGKSTAGLRAAQERDLRAAQGRDSSAAPPLVRALLAGFPDRVGLRRGERVLLASSGGARMAPESAAHSADLLLALELQVGPRGGDPLVRIGVPLQPEWLPTSTEVELVFDPEREAVVQRRATRYGALVLETKPVSGAPEPNAASEILLAAARKFGTDRLITLDRDAEELLGRVATLREALPELDLPAFTDDDLLAAACTGRRSFAQVRKANLARAVADSLSWAQRSALDEHAPERMRVPSGSRIRLRYSRSGEPPVLAARIQQLFGMTATPRIARGRVGVVVHLLAPNNRPAQVTRDLASFWTNTYPDVRKDLRGRYPKHAWPEDPSTAVAEDRPRRKR